MIQSSRPSGDFAKEQCPGPKTSRVRCASSASSEGDVRPQPHPLSGPARTHRLRLVPSFGNVTGRDPRPPREITALAERDEFSRRAAHLHNVSQAAQEGLRGHCRRGSIRPHRNPTPSRPAGDRRQGPFAGNHRTGDIAVPGEQQIAHRATDGAADYANIRAGAACRLRSSPDRASGVREEQD